ncbi:MAG: PAS domain S-box protein [Candidatus Aminicenantes bacterium]|nr:PAS domain S-box protein [Candidatus Aminicenantes bacterium]
MKTPGIRFGGRLVGRRKREARDVLAVALVALVSAGLSAAVTLGETARRFIDGSVPHPLFRSARHFLFLFLLGLLFLTYRRWRTADRREREIENILAAISPDALLVVDLARRIAMSSPSVKPMFGYEPEELIGRTTDLLYEDRRTDRRVPEIRDEIARTGHHLGRARGRRRNGAPMPLEIISAGLSGGGAVLLVRDISDRVKAEDALEESRRKAAAVVDNVLVGLFHASAEGRLTMANAALARLFGFGTPAEFLAAVKTLGPDLFADPDRHRELRRRLEAADEVLRFEARLQRPGGAPFWASLNLRAVRDPGGTLRGYDGGIEDISIRREAEETMRQSLERLRRSTGSIIDVMVMAVEARDPYTSGHQRRVADLARAIAAEMGLPRDRVDGLRMAGVVHDIGKISIPSEILTTPRKLSEIEFNLVKSHAQLGHDLIKDIDFPWPIAEMVLQHHERLDGSGYPRGLKGEAVMLEARILAVADVVEAISFHRPYRPALGLDRALEDISQGRGTLYDPEVADACLRLFREKGFSFDRPTRSAEFRQGG